VDIVGISNLMTFLNPIPEYWMPFNQCGRSVWMTTPPRRINSFCRSVHPSTVPTASCGRLLIGQGANDVRVKASESEQIVAAMQQHGMPP
jgi:hypothetical protein